MYSNTARSRSSRRFSLPCRISCALLCLVGLAIAPLATAHPANELPSYTDRLDATLVDYYSAPETPIEQSKFELPSGLKTALPPTLVAEIQKQIDQNADAATTIGGIRGRLQQAITLAMADAVKRGDLESAKAWRWSRRRFAWSFACAWAEARS